MSQKPQYRRGSLLRGAKHCSAEARGDCEIARAIGEGAEEIDNSA